VGWPLKLLTSKVIAAIVPEMLKSRLFVVASSAQDLHAAKTNQTPQADTNNRNTQ
jgi:hypothetical protein